MQVHITGRNLEITPAIKSFTEEKFQHIADRFKQVTKVNVILHVENVTHHAEVTAHYINAEIHASAKAGDMYSAIDETADKLQKQIVKHKDKITDHR